MHSWVIDLEVLFEFFADLRKESVGVLLLIHHQVNGEGILGRAHRPNVQVVDGGQVSGAVVRGLKSGDMVKLAAPIGQRLTRTPGDQRDLQLVAGGVALLAGILTPTAVDETEIP